MSLIVVRLYPAGGRAIAGADFSSYLDGLTIKLFDLATTAGEEQVGDDATYTAPPDPSHPEQPDPTTLIVQHFAPGPVPGAAFEPQAAATAVFEDSAPHPPAGRPEHATRDLRVEITRNGTIVDRRLYFNVPEAPGTIPADPSTFPDLEPTALYLGLPAPGAEILPTDAYVELPSNGAPVPYDNLLNAVARILGDDPGGTPALDTLTVPQARHVASEIVWNQKFRPLPGPTGADLGTLYTAPASDDANTERGQFEAGLTAYYATGDADAERLAGYVVALAAAVDAERRSTAATEVGLEFPVLPGQTGTGERYREARVLLVGLPANARATVPARYFYALGATLPITFDFDQRYEAAVLADPVRLRSALIAARDAGTITEVPPPASLQPPNLATTDLPVADAPSVNIAQAVRRLRALGDTAGAPPELPATGDVLALWQGWLLEPGEDINVAFWDDIVNTHPSGHLDLDLTALTRGYVDPADNVALRTKIRNGLGVADAPAVANTETDDWRTLFHADPTWPVNLPEWTRPGSPEERLTAFILAVRKFFDIAVSVPPVIVGGPDAAPLLRTPAGDPIGRFVAAYFARNGSAFAFGAPADPTDRDGALDDVAADIFGGNPGGRAWLDTMITTIDELVQLSAPVPQPVRFSVAEALFARGFTSRAQVAAMSLQGFADALVGTVAFEFSDDICTGAGGPGSEPVPSGGGFVPVNPDGCLVDCVPPEHVSPLGPVAYLQALLGLSVEASCDDPAPEDGPTLGELVATRRGPLGDLHATDANLDAPLPVGDIVNECLEALAGNPGTATGVVHDTTVGAEDGQLLAAAPQYSTPASPVAVPAAYTALAHDFSHPLLPYAQALDVNRSHLCALRTSRYEIMRRFRRDITELVLDPDAAPPGFRANLWRYPVRLELACEYLCISPEEYQTLYSGDPRAASGVRVWQQYGFHTQTIRNQPWSRIVVRVPEFLARTGLDWCDLVELWRSGIIPFGRLGGETRIGGDRRATDGDGEPPPLGFDDCEPCHLDRYALDLADPAADLTKLAIVIRLWRTLRDNCRPALAFGELADVCDVLGLFAADGSVNPDFVRQLAALDLLREEFGMPLRPGPAAPAGATGVDRTPLLALWIGPGTPGWDWAVDTLLRRVQHHAIRRYRSRPRPPEFIELLGANLDPISAITGFDPATPADTWHARPTHTLRLAELLAKVYASTIEPGELLYLFTADEHLQGTDPYPLAAPNEALDDPFDLPDDDRRFSLWALRDKLLAVDVETDHGWGWRHIEAALRDELGYAPPAGTDPLYTLGAHFFPHVLTHAGITVPQADRHYGVALAATPAAMWNTPADGPFQYVAGELTAHLPLRPDAVIAKLSRIRQLGPDEQHAVRELLAAPVADLAPFAFLFEDFDDAVRHLVEEPDEEARFGYFRRAVARCLARCHVIADHLAEHVVTRAPQEHPQPEHEADRARLAFRLLAHLHGDENAATAPWENDSGVTPPLTFDRPTGGAFAALLALTGTGLLGEYRTDLSAVAPRWREVRGALRAFDAAGNAANAPVPGVVPALDTTITPAQGRYVAVRNGFAMTDPAGEPLGGAQGYGVRWSGALLVDRPGGYTFHAGGPAPDGEAPDRDEAEGRHWRVTLRRGQRTWVLLAHRWRGERGAPAHTTSLPLRRGAYDLLIELVQPQPEYDDPDDIVAATGGFQLSYAGPDTEGRIVAIPRRVLFRPTQEPLGLAAGIGIELTATEQAALSGRYTGSLRDIRRTYQRAYKAMLLAHRLDLSAAPIADDGQSEIGYLLAHPDLFSGAAYYRSGPGFATHLAGFDPDLLPLLDTYRSPSPGDDARVAPSRQRRAGLTDWWERLYDYTVMRRHSARSPERPAWLLFHESAEGHPDIPADLLRYLGVDLRRTDLVCRFDPGVVLSSADLVDERWPLRVWHADLELRAILERFEVADIRTARPDLWAADDPSSPPDASSGNANLTRFVTDGFINSGPPRRFADLAKLNDCLRERGRSALIAYLCQQNRVSLPWGDPVREAKDLSALLLLDVEAGGCQRASRVQEAISAVQTLVSRARIGLEPALIPSTAFLALWDARLASYRVWEACRRRELYRENWVDVDEIAAAQATEAYQFFEAELRRATLTVPAPGGMEYWSAPPLPGHPGLALLQVRDPSVLLRVDPHHHGFDLMGTPDRDARPSWLAAVGLPAVPAETLPGPDDDRPPDDDGQPDDGHGIEEYVPPEVDVRALVDVPPDESARLPWWIRSAVRLGTRFLRVAAAGVPPAGARPAAPSTVAASSCCAECGGQHPALVDEYYFWLVDSRWFDAQQQDAGWPWHEEQELPGLLAWRPERQVVLAWTRVHNGELSPVRHSAEAVQVTGPVELTFSGRMDDSLSFVVAGGTTPVGYPSAPPPGFRYDLASDEAVLLPEIPAVPPPPPPPAGPPTGPLRPGGLPAYPYFAYHTPGAPLFPPTPYPASISVAAALRAHCQFESALRWYEYTFDPLHSDSAWLRCQEGDDRGDDGDREDTGGERPVPAPALEQPRGRRRSSAEVAAAHREAIRSGLGLCCTDSTVADDDEVRRRSILLHYLETLLDLGGALMRHRPTPEAFAQARIVIETAATLLGPPPRVVQGTDEPDPAPTVTGLVPHPPRPNPRLLRLYDEVADRLALIRTCQNAARRRNGRLQLDMPYLGDSRLVDGWLEPATPCPDDEWCQPQSPYRFAYLLPRAVEAAGVVRGLGAALQAAHEKGDAQFLEQLRADQDRVLASLTIQVRQAQWRDADWQVQALTKTKEAAQSNRRYYADLVEHGLISSEIDYLSLMEQAVGAYGTSIPLEAIGQVLAFIPDIWLGVAGMGPLDANQLPLGTKLAGVFATAARIANTLGTIAGTTAGKRLTQAGWERREAEWRHQVEVLDIEIEQIERQILGAQRRRDAALRELNNAQRQLEHLGRILDFERDKLTGHALFLWLQQETAALYYQMYELARGYAYQAQRAFNFERGHTAQDFLAGPVWDTLHEGLLAGERLETALRRMEHTYLDLNAREYELTKHVSLRLAFPQQYLALLATGCCEFELPEWLFDLDYPGQYLRRIKNVSLSIPCVVGPYTGVHARLTLLSSTTRVSPELSATLRGCCQPGTPAPDCRCDERCCCGPACCGCGGPCGPGTPSGYELLPDDPRAVHEYAAREAIATSSGQNDTGLFEVNFRDERYLPFELHGAVSRWRLELPPENNQFDLATVADVVLHVAYTAREAGDRLRQAANEQAQRRLPGDGLCLVDVAHDLPDMWYELRRHPDDPDDRDGRDGRRRSGAGRHRERARRAALRLSRAMFPFIPAPRQLCVTAITFLIDVRCTVAGEHHTLRYYPSRPDPGGEFERVEFEEVECVTSDQWPGMFCGVLSEVDFGRIAADEQTMLGTVELPPTLAEPARMWLLCTYRTDCGPGTNSDGHLHGPEQAA
jgi:Tc toxin complex TcA C-terminal TcB-binding domain